LPDRFADITNLKLAQKFLPAALAGWLDSDKITLVANETAALTASRSGNTESGLGESSLGRTANKTSNLIVLAAC
jgi:hypothetical protein